MYLASLGLGSVVASVQILGRRAILGGVSLGCRRFLPVQHHKSDLPISEHWGKARLKGAIRPDKSRRTGRWNHADFQC